MEQPKLILFDAVGTLFGIRGSVGEVYRAIALPFGVDVPGDTLHEAFVATFKDLPYPTFADTTAEGIQQQEYTWWEMIARSTFERVGVYEQFTDFATYFQELFDYFATDQPWYLYEDVLPALEHWHSKGIELGIVSNFDSRLEKVLDALNLSEFFSSVTLPGKALAAKPEAKIFQAALAQHECHSSQAWHIGDSIKEDYLGARAAGIRSFLIERSPSATKTTNLTQSEE